MKSIFFDSQIEGYDIDGLPIYDRPNDATDLRNSFASFISNGVFIIPSTNFQVLENTGMSVKVLAGKCWINGAFAYEAEERELIFQNSESLDRIDRVVLRLDLSLAQRNIDLYVLKGLAGAVPSPIPLTRNDTIYEICIADIFITKNSTGISQSRITDTRLDTSLCGVVHSVFEQVDTTAIFNQFEGWYNVTKEQAEINIRELLDQLNGLVEGDAVGNLQVQINNKANKSLIENINLLAVNWTDTIYTAIGISNITLMSNIIISINQNATIEQTEEYINSQILAVEQGTGFIKFRAKEKPSIDIPISILILG